MGRVVPHGGGQAEKMSSTMSAEPFVKLCQLPRSGQSNGSTGDDVCHEAEQD